MITRCRIRAFTHQYRSTRTSLPEWSLGVLAGYAEHNDATAAWWGVLYVISYDSNDKQLFFMIFKMNMDFSLESTNRIITNEYQKFDSVFKWEETASLLFQAINVIGFTSKNFNLKSINANYNVQSLGE